MDEMVDRGIQILDRLVYVIVSFSTIASDMDGSPVATRAAGNNPAAGCDHDATLCNPACCNSIGRKVSGEKRPLAFADAPRMRRSNVKSASGLFALAALLCSAPAFAAEDNPTVESPPGCITSSSSAEQKAAAADNIISLMLAPRPGMPPTPGVPPATFATDMTPLVKQNVFGNVWPRCGLSRRDRSLVTLGILIALRADFELRYHFPIAVRNGLTRSELEEVIYQASAYAGFPAAASARVIAQETLPAVPAK